MNKWQRKIKENKEIRKGDRVLTEFYINEGT